MKPLIICGGCSFTHAPDSWAQVLGHSQVSDMKNPDYCEAGPSEWAQEFFEGWKQYGIQIAEANPDIFPDNLQEYWDQGEDMSELIDVIVVGQGAAGQELNSRVIRDVIQSELSTNPERKIGVFWQLSGWDRIEMLSNRWDVHWHDELYNMDEHMTSVIRPWIKVPTELAAVTGHISHDPELQPRPEYHPKSRYWWKSGGAEPTQWEGSPLEKFVKHYYEDVWTSEYSAIRNLEIIEYTRGFCDQRNIPITIFPGWDQTWNRGLDVGAIQSMMTPFDMLNRLPHDIVTDIDYYHGIAEWGYQHQIYQGPAEKDVYLDETQEPIVQRIQAEEGSQFEKYWNKETNEFGMGNHPSGHTHAAFCNDWIKPRVKQMLEKFN